MPHPDCPLAGTDHDRHYLGRDARGVSQRCEGDVEEDRYETGWTPW